MQLARIAQAFNGGKGAAADLSRECDATRTRHTIDQHGAGSTFARFAAMLDAKISFLAQGR